MISTIVLLDCKLPQHAMMGVPPYSIVTTTPIDIYKNSNVHLEKEAAGAKAAAVLAETTNAAKTFMVLMCI